MKIVGTFAVISVLVLAFFNYQQYKNNRNVESDFFIKSAELNKITEEKIYLSEAIENYIRLQIKYSNENINNVFLYNVRTKKKSSLEQLVGRENVLILNITENACDICFDKIYDIFKSFISQANSKKVLVVCPPDRYKEVEFVFSSQMDSLDMSLYIPEKKDQFFISSELSKLYSPLIFVCDGSLRVQKFFIPITYIDNLDALKELFKAIE